MNVRFWGVRGSVPTSQTAADIRERLNAAFLLMPHPPKDRRELAKAIDKLPFYVRGTFGGCTTCIEFDADGTPPCPAAMRSPDVSAERSGTTLMVLEIMPIQQV